MFASSDTPDPGAFEAIYRALEADSRPEIGPADPRLLVIPIRDDTGGIAGGLWGLTAFRWLQLEMLVVPPQLRNLGIGSALLAAAETEARRRLCLGIQLDAFEFQAAAFYRKRGFTVFGTLDDCPPGHRRVFLQKRLG